MIKVRLNAFSESVDVAPKENENLKALVERVLLDNGHKEVSDNLLEHMAVMINAMEIPREMWEVTVYTEADEVLVCPVIRGGGFGQIFKTIAIVVITIVASVALTPAGGATIGSALSVAAISVASTLALNALIPPPKIGASSMGALGSSLEASQMYSITGQSNNANKYGYVQKSYGTHRSFPTVAANPYTEVETDPSTGTLVQYFYCIYDFGIGPLAISDVKIGNTPISDYSDVTFRLVDPNKPDVDEGSWDTALGKTFELYKGDLENDNTSVAINKNEEQGGALEDYQVIRNASSEVEGDFQEIILDFINPSGLISYSPTGESYEVNIDLEIYFSKVGEDNWKAYNDLTYVSGYQYAGGSDVYDDVEATYLPLVDGSYPLLYSYEDYFFGFLNPSESKYRQRGYGIPKGSTQVVLGNNSGEIGDVLIFNNLHFTTIIGKSAHSVGFSTYTFSTPLPFEVTIFSTEQELPLNQPPGPITIFPNIFGMKPVQRRFQAIGKARITRKDANAAYSTVKFKPREIGAFKVRIKRLKTSTAGTYQVISNLTLSSLITRFDRKPINTPNRHVFLELKIRATNQLNGSVQNLSAVARSVLDVYDSNTQTWSKQITSNPAWVFCDLLTGQVNKRAISKNRLHMPSIVEWAEFCDEIPTAPPGETYNTPRFQCNFVLDFESTLQQVLNLVCNASQTSLNITDGKYGVLLDKLKTTPVQIFTPRNSRDFSSNKNFAVLSNAIKVKFIEPEANWEIRERIVYQEGYDENNAETFDELDSFACTSSEQAYRFGKYMMAQAILRQETITITVDFEYLVCTRGDYVRYVQDSMKVGGRAARVKTVIGQVITIDDGIETDPLLDYGFMYRSPIQGFKQGSVNVLSSDTFEIIGPDLPEKGNLIVIGEVDHLYIDCLVKAINPQGDLTAQLVLVEKADAIYEVESTGVIPPYSPQIAPTEDTQFSPPSEVENFEIDANTYRCLGSDYQYYIQLDWDVPQGAAYELFEIYADSGKGYNLVTYTKETFYEYIVNPANLGLEHKFKVLAVSATGKKLDLGEVGFVSATPLRKTSPPMSIEALYLNVTDQTIQLDWKAINDCDVAEYLVRFAPNSGGTWESSIPLLRTDRNTTLAQAQARTGTYLIKAVDFNGNESETAAIAITSIPELTGLNIIDETNDFPDLEGNLVQTIKDGDALVLQKVASGDPLVNEYYTEGYYYFANFLDLGEIYTVRLQSLIEAEGFTVEDIMSNWVTLDSVLAMSNSRQSEWDVETQFRATDNFNVMSEWVSLDLVDPISGGQDDNWTEWKKFTIGDFTGRIFQFRLKLVSNKASVTPRVFNGIIRSDMPDRQESYNNLLAPDTGYDLVYTPAFKGPGTSPNIQVTQDNAESGDYWKTTAKTLNGCKITFYDKNDIAVSRTFDVSVKGYGRKANAVI